MALLIALDYDDTYTKDPELWLSFINLALSRGHRVEVATMRYPSEGDDMDKRLTSLIPVNFTHRKAKRKALSDNGVKPHIWIDDRPEWIISDA